MADEGNRWQAWVMVKCVQVGSRKDSGKLSAEVIGDRDNLISISFVRECVDNVHSYLLLCIKPVLLINFK